MVEPETEISREKVSFWWVWTKYGKTPRYFHKSAESAEKEAARLAGKYPKQKFIVLHGYAKFGHAALRPPVQQAEAA